MEKFEISTQLLEKFFAKKGYRWENETILPQPNSLTLPLTKTSSVVGTIVRLSEYPKQYVVSSKSYRFIVSISTVQCNISGISCGNFSESFQNTLLKQLGPDYANYLSLHYEQEIFDNEDKTRKKISEIDQQIAKLQAEKETIKQESATQEEYYTNRMQYADKYKNKSKGLAAKKVIENKDDILIK